MPIISVEIMKTIYERELQKTAKEKQTKTERSKRNRSYTERMRGKWFCYAFKLGFLQLICKASLIFEVEFRVSLINYFKTKRIIWVKACCGGVQMFKNMGLVILFDMLLNPSVKMTTSLANIARATPSTSKFIY